MFSAISPSTTTAIAPVSPVSAPAPAAPVRVTASAPAGGNATAAGNPDTGASSNSNRSVAIASTASNTRNGQPTLPTTSAFAAANNAQGTASNSAQGSSASQDKQASDSASTTHHLPKTLDAQLIQVENRLADCVNCSTANTPEGQAQIDALSSQLRQIRQMMLGNGDTGSAYGMVPPPIGLNLDAQA